MVDRGGGHCFLTASGALLNFFVIDLTSFKKQRIEDFVFGFKMFFFKIFS